MALRKLISLSGKSYVQTDVGIIETANAVVQMNAYIKVEAVNGDKLEVSANVSFVDENKKFIKTYKFNADLNGPNYIAQAYNYLKTLSEFENAIDC